MIDHTHHIEKGGTYEPIHVVPGIFLINILFCTLHIDISVILVNTNASLNSCDNGKSRPVIYRICICRWQHKESRSQVLQLS